MNKKITGAILLFLICSVGIVLLYYLLPYFQDRHQKVTSDATKTRGKIRIAMDNWVGYFPLRSPEMKNLMRRAGWILVCEDDNANYDQRMQRLKKHEIDLAVATVDSFILNAEKYGYPGTIISVIDESKGGDAILAVRKRVNNLDGLKGKRDIRVAFTPDSPSHHLAKAAADHFNVRELLPRGTLRIDTDGSEKAREKLLSGKADVAILWEPDVSRALSHDGIVKILGTEDTERLIVDILIAGREFSSRNPDVIKLLLNNYFRTLKKYRQNPQLLLKHVKDETGLAETAIRNMLKGVKWASFHENCETWFGIAAPGNYAEEGLVDTIQSTVTILTNSGDFSSSPIPDADPYRLTNSSFLEQLFTKGITGFTTPVQGAKGSGPVESIETKFAPLDEQGWESLKEVGTLKVEPIVFQHGTKELGLLAKQVVDEAIQRLRHYPNFRVVIKGHTGTRGDHDENLRLSRDRAEAVARYLNVVYNIDPQRLRPVGFGGKKPLPKRPGESRRAYEYRLPRVELVLAREDF